MSAQGGGSPSVGGGSPSVDGYYLIVENIQKTYVSALMDEGVNLNTIREFVGHTDEKTTLNCYCFDRSDNDERLARVEKALSV